MSQDPQVAWEQLLATFNIHGNWHTKLEADASGLLKLLEDPTVPPPVVRRRSDILAVCEMAHWVAYYSRLLYRAQITFPVGQEQLPAPSPA